MMLAACIALLAVMVIGVGYGLYDSQRRHRARRTESSSAQQTPIPQTDRVSSRSKSGYQRSNVERTSAPDRIVAGPSTPQQTSIRETTTPEPNPEPSKPTPKKAKVITSIWQAGILNGKPAGPDGPHIPAEYRVHSSDETPYDVRKPGDMPQVIKAGQSVILRVEDLPQQTLTLRAVINTGKPRPHCYPWIGVKHPSFLQVLLNDEIVYYRWLAVSSNWLTIRLPERHVRQGYNTIVLRNMAGADWGVDSVWIEKPTQDQSSWLALSEAEWLDEKRAQHIPFMGLSFYPNLPNSSDEELARLKASSPIRLKSLSSRRRRWSDEKWGQRAPSDVFPDEWFQKYFKDWRGRIDNVLMRGGEPVIHITTGTQLEQGWLRLFALFRPFVRYWVLDCQTVKGVDELTAFMRQLSPDIGIRIAYRGEGSLSRDLLRDTGLCLPAMNVRPMDETLAQHRRSLVSRSMSSSLSLSPALVSRFLMGVRGVNGNARGSLDIARMTVTWLHEGGGPIYMYGGRVGGGVFPERASEPAFVWDMLRTVLPLSRENSRRLTANVTPYDSNVGLFDAAWCAVANSPDQVSMLIFTDTDRNRNVTVECPVHWRKGKTIVEFRPVTLDAKKVPVTGETEIRTIDTDSEDEGGVVRFQYRLASLTLIRIRPEGKSRFMRQPIRESFAAERAVVPFESNLFRPSSERVLTGRWTNPLFAQGSRRLSEVVDAASRLDDCVASMGKLGTESRTVPWNDRSLRLTFVPDGADAARPKGARIFLDRGKYKAATDLEIWVMPRSTNLKAKSVTLVVGTSHVRSNVRLQVGKWQCLRAPFSKLVQPGWDRGFNLRIWPHAEDRRNGTTVSFEFNAFHAVGSRPAEDQAPDRSAELVKVGEKSGKVDYLLLAKPGKPAQVNLRLKNAIAAKTLICKDVSAVVRLHSKARILRVTVKAMPDKSTVPPDILSGVPAAVQTRLKNGAQTAVHIRLVKR